IELLGVSSIDGIKRQLSPLINTDISTVVCCPMGWRFYNFPSKVDLTWKESDKFPRNNRLYPNWKKMVDNLNKGRDPLKDALERTRSQEKEYTIKHSINDNHFGSVDDHQTHN